MEIRKSDAGEITILQLLGRFEAFEDANKLKSTVMKALQEGQRRFVVDFKYLEWISSTGIGAIVGSYKRIREKKGIMCAARVNVKVMAILKITNIHRIFRIYDTLEDATDFVSIYEERIFEQPY